MRKLQSGHTALFGDFGPCSGQILLLRELSSEVKSLVADVRGDILLLEDGAVVLWILHDLDQVSRAFLLQVFRLYCGLGSNFG